GSISGTVKTSDGNAAAYVSVGIIGNHAGAVTNEKGEYRIHKIKPGTYTVKVSAVNLAPQQKEVTVTEAGNVVADFMLTINSSQLQEVVIKDRINRIKVDNPSQTLRLQEPLLEVPQNIQVVSSTAIAEQQIISMSDGLIRNVSGAVRLEHWGDLYTNITMRGSQIQAFRNGFNVVSSYWGPLTEDMSIVDHIEFVKGPAGFMLANGDPSGLYNVVTKKPTGVQKGEFTLTGGSYNLYRATLDLDGKLSKDGKFLYRLNIAGQKKGSHRQYEHNDRYTVAPVISYQFDDKTKITAEYTWQRANMTDIGSFYVFGKGGYATYDRNFTQYAPGTPPTNINDHSAFVTIQHKLNDKWKLTGQASYFNYIQKGSSMWPDSVKENTIQRGTDIWDAKSEMILAQAFANGTVTTGGIKHRILTGIDFGAKDYKADWMQSHSYDVPVTGEFDNLNPNYGTPANGFPVFDRDPKTFDIRAADGGGLMSQNYAALYLQDELGFFNNKVRLTLAGRYTYVTQSAWGEAALTGKKFTPRVGLSVSVTDDFSVYGLHDQAFVPQGGKLTGGGIAKPITGSNTEFGIKKDWADGKWNTTVSVYQIVKNNEITADPNASPNSGLNIVLGQKKAKGIEFDLRGELFKGLTLTANYALTDSRVSKLNPNLPDPTPDMVVGAIIPGYAKHVANGWLNYKLQSGLLKGSGIAAGFTYLAGRETDTWSASDVRLPNYFKLDGGLFWEGSKLRINANVFNVLDKYLYTGSYYSDLAAFYWQSEPGRNYRVSVTYRF
ncbi:MAG: TonB-dependent receptor, partial [Sphingobacteriales bacterium]